MRRRTIWLKIAVLSTILTKLLGGQKHFFWRFEVPKQKVHWEVLRVAEFFNTIGQFNGTQEGEDELWWQGSEKGTFKVSKAYKKLNLPNQPSINWPWKNSGGSKYLIK